MKSKDKLINQVISSFQQLKGRASLYCYDRDAAIELAYSAIKNYAIKRPDRQIFVVVDSYEKRAALNRYIIGASCSESLNLNVRILSEDFVKSEYKYEYDFILTIGVNDNLPLITKLYKESRFLLCILTQNIMDYDFITNLRKILPSIDTAEYENRTKQDKIYSPVEEIRYGVELSDEDKILYKEYSEYIATSVTIFGDLKNIDKCKRGDELLGISGASFREQIAMENGWRNDLDTTIPYMKQIDDTYNPNILLERACNFYNITKKRTDLVTDNDTKLYQILKICEENVGKKILIVSKRGEFAAKVTKFINEMNNITIKCGDYHDCLEEVIATDDNGNILYVKSGVDKGKPRKIQAQAQSTTNERRFNYNIINTLSVKNSSNPKLKIACDIVIFTSPLCDNIIDFKTRFHNIEFTTNPTKTYKVYCCATIEYDKMIREKPNNLISITDNTENLIEYDENLGNIIL